MVTTGPYVLILRIGNGPIGVANCAIVAPHDSQVGGGGIIPCHTGRVDTFPPHRLQTPITVLFIAYPSLFQPVLR